jgi:hypothetical protein
VSAAHTPHELADSEVVRLLYPDMPLPEETQTILDELFRALERLQSGHLRDISKLFDGLSAEVARGAQGLVILELIGRMHDGQKWCFTAWNTDTDGKVNLHIQRDPYFEEGGAA